MMQLVCDLKSQIPQFSEQDAQAWPWLKFHGHPGLFGLWLSSPMFWPYFRILMWAAGPASNPSRLHAEVFSFHPGPPRLEPKRTNLDHP